MTHADMKLITYSSQEVCYFHKVLVLNEHRQHREVELTVIEAHDIYS